MDVKILEQNDRRTHLVQLTSGEAVVSSIASYVRDKGIRAGSIRGRGRMRRLTLMRPAAADATGVPCPADVLVMDGDVVVDDAGPSVVLQVLVALGDGGFAGGRIAEAVADRCEITVTESPLVPPRRIDPATGVALADLSAGERDARPPNDPATSGSVDEAADESFPASDPPSFAGVPGS